MNAEKINKLIETLQTYPEFYDQSKFGYRKKIFTGHYEGPDSETKCGTRACLAGYVVMMEGYSLLFDHDAHTTFNCHRGEQKFNIEELATRILGLAEKDARILFAGGGCGWRHEKEFHRAHETRHADVAVQELEDLLRLGSYPKRKKKLAEIAPAVVPPMEQEKVPLAPQPQQQPAESVPVAAAMKPARRTRARSIREHSAQRRAFQDRGIRLRFRAQMRKAWQMK